MTGTLPRRAKCAVFHSSFDAGPYVVAEIGVNHEGDLDLARRLIDDAASGGADAVKFQTYKAHKLAARNSPAYWDLSCEPTKSQFELFQKYDRFEANDYVMLADYAKQQGVAFCSTPFDSEAVEMLAPYVPFFKIASADITNTPLLEACAAHSKPIVLSTGATHLGEITEAVRLLLRTLPPEEIAILQCVLEYPTPYEDANLGAIHHLKSVFPEHPIGYSDHTRPDSSMLLLLRAWMLGAEIIEKHVTHDKTLPGNDHYHAMDKTDLKRFRDSVSLIVAAEGSGRKTLLPGEATARENARRSLVATRNLDAGHRLEARDLVPKRPASGLPPSALEWVLGKKLTKDLAEDDFLTYDHVLET